MLATDHCINLVHDSSLRHFSGMSCPDEAYLTFDVPTRWLRYVDLASGGILHLFDRLAPCYMSEY